MVSNLKKAVLVLIPNILLTIYIYLFLNNYFVIRLPNIFNRNLFLKIIFFNYIKHIRRYQQDINKILFYCNLRIPGIIFNFWKKKEMCIQSASVAFTLNESVRISFEIIVASL